ncbi:hypothetical protein [Streptomyces sp. NPDC005955]|uniref:hypothetical protein n=1 Tax=Streptomyces sp. NPDC005955 TaxID=3364738 RepID=UPI0036B92DE6
MDFEALRNAEFGPLDTAVSDWSRLVRNLESMEKDARDGLKRRAAKANWQGINATVSRQFVGKTVGEFTDARTQASSVRNILRDTRDELRSHRRTLEEALDRGSKRNLTVVATGGGGFTVTMRVHPDRAGTGTDPSAHGEADVLALRDEVQEILEAATRSDDTASDVLRALVDQSEHGFSGASYGDRDGAVRAVREAAALARLARQNPGDLSVKEFDRLLAGLERYGDDALFAERFAAELGAAGTLEFWTGINDPGHGIEASSRGGNELMRERLTHFDDLQRHLGLTLAHATQSDSAAMSDWKREMIRLGEQPIGPSGMHQGFQVMSNLMRHGDYDDGFLKQYGDALVEAEKQHGDGDGKAPAAWHNLGLDPRLNHVGPDGGSDPFTGFMKALANSPDAATTFFGETFRTASEAGGGSSVDNFTYFFEQRDWPSDLDSEKQAGRVGRDMMAQALEAAVTGHPAGELPTVNTPAHGAEQARLMERVIGSISEDPDRLLNHRYMADSIGQMTAEYMPDVHRGLHPATESNTRLFPVAGTAAVFESDDLTRVLYAVGRDPAGYAAVTMGQSSYTGNIMEYHFRNPEANISDPLFSQPENLKASIEGIANIAGEIQGTISAGRAYEGEKEEGARNAEYNTALEKSKVWTSATIGIGVGIGVASIAGPWGIAAGGIAGTASNEILNGIVTGSLQDDASQVIYRNGEEIGDTRDSTFKAVEMAAEEAGRLSGSPSPHIVAIVAEEAGEGFNTAHTKISEILGGQKIPDTLETK